MARSLAKHTGDASTIDWLMSGDVAIQFQTKRDLFGTDQARLQNRISKQGWGRQYLDCRNPDGTWGEAFYQPKWTSTHYTLLELKKLQMVPNTPDLLDIILDVANRHIGADGGIGHRPGCQKSDVCINGMFLNYACYFGASEQSVKPAIDFLLTEAMADGGFNCMSNRSGARHSSLHSTISVLEGLLEYQRARMTYRLAEVQNAVASSEEFILQHRFFKSDRTGKIINPEFLKMPYPPRWRYNVLRALDFFRDANVPFDPRMKDALQAIAAKRRKDGKWPLNAAFPGRTHFVMEPSRRPSRWNTLIALRILRAYGDGSE